MAKHSYLQLDIVNTQHSVGRAIESELYKTPPSSSCAWAGMVVANNGIWKVSST